MLLRFGGGFGVVEIRLVAANDMSVGHSDGGSDHVSGGSGGEVFRMMGER